MISCLCICKCVCLSVYVYVYKCVCRPMCVSQNVYPCVYVSLCVFVCVCSYVCAFVCVYVWVRVCPSGCLLCVRWPVVHLSRSVRPKHTHRTRVPSMTARDPLSPEQRLDVERANEWMQCRVVSCLADSIAERSPISMRSCRYASNWISVSRVIPHKIINMSWSFAKHLMPCQIKYIYISMLRCLRGNCRQ